MENISQRLGGDGKQSAVEEGSQEALSHGSVTCSQLESSLRNEASASSG